LSYSFWLLFVIIPLHTQVLSSSPHVSIITAEQQRPMQQQSAPVQLHSSFVRLLHFCVLLQSVFYARVLTISAAPAIGRARLVVFVVLLLISFSFAPFLPFGASIVQ